MTTITDVLERVTAEQAKKSDEILSLRSMIPLVGEEGPKMKQGRKTERYFTKTGLASYLSKIDVPIKFFNKCSDELQEQIMAEHQMKHLLGLGSKDPNILLRIYDNQIRYMASTKYSKFDDIDVARSLANIDGLDNYNIGEYKQTSDFFVLRLLDKELYTIGKRPYQTGIQVMNSEVGKSSIKVQFLIYEQVCTNGMVVEVGGFTPYKKKHIGRKESEDLRIGTIAMIDELPKFREESLKKLGLLDSDWSAKEFLMKLEKDARIPTNVYENTLGTLPKYSGLDVDMPLDKMAEAATALDASSAFTEAIQTYSWESRNQYEKIAGEFLWAA